MRVKILKNCPPKPNSFSIEKYAGKIYDATPLNDDNGTIQVDFGFVGTLIVYAGEYEIVDIVKNLDEFINRNCEFSIASQEIKDFILANRVGLAKLLNKQ